MTNNYPEEVEESRRTRDLCGALQIVAVSRSALVCAVRQAKEDRLDYLASPDCRQARTCAREIRRSEEGRAILDSVIIGLAFELVCLGLPCDEEAYESAS